MNQTQEKPIAVGEQAVVLPAHIPSATYELTFRIRLELPDAFEIQTDPQHGDLLIHLPTGTRVKLTPQIDAAVESHQYFGELLSKTIFSGERSSTTNLERLSGSVAYEPEARQVRCVQILWDGSEATETTFRYERRHYVDDLSGDHYLALAMTDLGGPDGDLQSNLTNIVLLKPDSNFTEPTQAEKEQALEQGLEGMMKLVIGSKVMEEAKGRGHTRDNSLLFWDPSALLSSVRGLDFDGALDAAGLVMVGELPENTYKKKQ